MSTPAPDPLPRTLLATVPQAVTLADGSLSTVEVRRLSIRQLYQFARHLGAMEGPELVALCTGKPAEWCDTLSPESFAAVHKSALELNFTHAAKIAEGDPRLAALLIPFITDAQLVAVLGGATTATLSTGAGSPASSPAPAPSASAEATGNAA